MIIMKLNAMSSLQIPFALLLLTFSFVAFASPTPNERGFLSCLVKLDSSMSSIIYTPKNTQFLSVLNFLIQNVRFINPQTPKPKALLRPVKESQIQTAIYCGKKHHLEMRIRSGGHDFEGSSYISQVPFFVLDMFNFQSLSVDSRSKTAWIGVGLSLGQTYYGIYSANSSLAFTGGFWPTVGIGGHISGGGYGPLVRQHGLAADNVIDARMIDVNGRILDRKSMGDDLFWAIRGGVGANFGVILSYKVRLFEVPKTVTGFRINRTEEQNAIQLVYKWQQIARKLPLELTLTVELRAAVSTETGKRTVRAEFVTVYRGGVNELLSIMGRFFPELGVTKEDCREMTWIEAYPFLVDLQTDNVEALLTNRPTSLSSKRSFKWKVDFPKDPIPPEGLAKIFNEVNKAPTLATQVGFTIFGGGIMDQIPESKIPFPHRGVLLVMRQIIYWNSTDSSAVVQSRLNWVRRLHKIMEQYVPNNPRAQYADYRDLDLGVGSDFSKLTSIGQAKKWGLPYFKDNFYRLVKVKTLVDPQNYFHNEQSIPPLRHH